MTVTSPPRALPLPRARSSLLERRLALLALPLVVAAAALALALYAPFVLTWPPISSDEGREMNAFWVAVGTDPQATLLDPFFGRDPLYKGGVQGISVGLALRLLGPSLAVARLVSSLWAGLLLVATFLAGRRLFGTGAAAAAATVLAASEPFLLSAHFVRPDVVVAALLMAALWLALFPAEVWPAHLGAGLLLGLAVDVHPNAVAFLPLVGLPSLLSAGQSAPRALRWLGGGLALGAAVYLGVRVAPDPARYLASLDFWVGMEKRPPLLAGTLAASTAGEWGRFAQHLAGRPLELLVLAASLAWSAARALRGSRAHLLVLLGLLAAFALFSLLVVSKVPFYLVLYYAPLSLLIGATIAEIAARLPGRLWAGAGITLLVALFGFGLLGYARDLGYRYVTGDHDYPLLQQRLRAEVPAGAVVAGQPLYWPALADHRFVDIDVAERLRLQRRTPLEAFLRQSGATVVLMDDDTRRALPAADRAWLLSHSEKRATITQKYYGTIDVRVLAAPP